jgi:3-hexulose-6-phosphate synthase/6-phospho-3-hexuloisomerase
MVMLDPKLGREPILQLALDFIELSRALKVSKEAIKGGVDWLEVGTPLIKSEGMNAVRVIREEFKNRVIVADLKTMDTGRLEAEMVFKSGANVAIVLGVSDDSTIKEAVEAAENYGGYVMVDIINVSNPLERSVKLEELGVDIICVHVGIDQQMRGVDPLNLLERIREKVSIPLAIAGGITSENAGIAVEKGADVIIVGGAITKAENAEEAAKLIKRAMLERRVIEAIKGRKAKTEEELLKILKIVSVANLSDAMHRGKVLTGFKQVIPGSKIYGRVVTVRTYPGDWAKPVEAIDYASEGDIIVIDANGGEAAVWGELASWSAKNRKVTGVIINGGARDIEDIRKLGFPVFAKHFCGRAGEPKGYGEINVPIDIEGVKIKPGDYIVAEEEGIIVVPREHAQEIINRALDVKEREDRVREEIKRGSTLSKVIDLYRWEKKG